MRLVFAKGKHARQRRDAKRRDACAEENTRAHVDHSFIAGVNVKLVSAAGARRVEQRVEGESTCVGGRSRDPELGEPRKFFALTTDGVDRKAPRRQTVVQPCAERTKVTGAEEDDDFVFVFSAVQRVVRAKTRETHVTPSLRRQLVLAIVKVGAFIGNMMHALRHDFVDANRLGLVLTEMEEHQLKRQALRSPQGVIGAKSNVPVLVVSECLQLRRRLAAYASIRPAGLQLSSRSDVVEAERSRRVTVKNHQQQAHKRQRPPCVGGGVTVRRGKAESGLHQLRVSAAVSHQDITLIGTTGPPTWSSRSKSGSVSRRLHKRAYRRSMSSSLRAKFKT